MGVRWWIVALLIVVGCARTELGLVRCPQDPTSEGLCSNGSDGDTIDDGEGDSGITVTPVYAASANWNAYVRRDVPAAVLWAQSGTACDGSETGGPDACIHGGELRHAAFTAATSCTGLTARDDLDVLTWVCDDTSTVTFFSSGLKAGRGLRDLVSASGFLENHLIVDRDGTSIAQSAPAVWWSNQVQPLPVNDGTGVATLDSAATVYVAATSQSSDGYNINADGVAVVGLSGAILSYSGASTNNCSQSTGETASADYICLLSVGDQRFIWLEATLAMTTNTAYGVRWANVHFSQLQRSSIDAAQGGIAAVSVGTNSSANRIVDLSVENASQFGLEIRDSDHHVIDKITVNSGGAQGISLTNVNDSRLTQLRLANNTGAGIFMTGSHRNVIADVVATNTHDYLDGYGTAHGVHFYGQCSDNVVTSVLSTGNFGIGVVVQGSYAEGDTIANTFTHLSLINNNMYGFYLNASGNDSIVNILAINDASNGVSSGAPSSSTANVDNVFDDVVSAHNGGIGVVLGMARQNRFMGGLWLGSNATTPCYVDGGTQPGLIHNTCSDTGLEGSDSYSGQLSTAVLHINRDYTTSFVGKISDETTNTSDAAGLASYDAITDWTNFVTPFRVWGRDGSTFPASDHRGPCLTGESCRIWDWRLAITDEQLHDIHGAFTPEATCPASAHGDQALEDQTRLPYDLGIVAEENSDDGLGNDDGTCETGEQCHNVFLTSALEIRGDAIGDDDGLCESNESCTFSPNLGAYQGEGTLTAPCVFQDGIVRGVRLVAYTTNGD